MRAVVVALVLAVLLAACGDSSGSGSAPTATATPTPPPPSATRTLASTETPTPTAPPFPTKVADCTGQPDGVQCVAPCGNGVCEQENCVGECTPSFTATPTQLETPTCVPSPGIPSCCSAHCEPCPTIRAGCYARACQDCIERPVCDPFPTCGPNPFTTPTPTPTPTCIGCESDGSCTRAFDGGQYTGRCTEYAIIDGQCYGVCIPDNPCTENACAVQGDCLFVSNGSVLHGTCANCQCRPLQSECAEVENVGGCCDFQGQQPCFPLVYGSDAARCFQTGYGYPRGCYGSVTCNAATGLCEDHGF